MDFDPTERQVYWRDRVRQFIENHVRPRTGDYKAQDAEGSRWKVLPVVEEEKARAKAQGIWNLFMPPQAGRAHLDDTFEFEGPGLTNLEYALCAEEMGRVGFASEAFNCSAPDTGNMEVFHRYGTREQKEKWLAPLMNGEIRSAFLMTDQSRRAMRAKAVYRLFVAAVPEEATDGEGRADEDQVIEIGRAHV